jgi:hypothetical protein
VGYLLAIYLLLKPARENNLNIKVIILDERGFKSKDEDNVLKCASGAKEEIPNPTPEYYIMAAYVGGNHYELISYKDKKILKFSEIPYYIKTLIVNKCIEKNAGSFPYITDFKHFQQLCKSGLPVECHI